MPRSGGSALHGVNPNLKKKKINLYLVFNIKLIFIFKLYLNSYLLYIKFFVFILYIINI